MTHLVPIRPAHGAESAQIALMSRELIEQGLGWSWTPARVRRSIGNAHVNVIVQPVGDGDVAGFGIMKYHDEEAHLLLLAVAPEYTRRGIGAALLGWLEKSALVAGLGQVLLEARAGNAAAHAFYRHQGYREIQRLPGYYRGREASVRFAKDLWTQSSVSA
jgi:ribosomal-protein-alanine N-acetyltransferase